MDGIELNATGNACKRHVAIFCSHDSKIRLALGIYL